MRTRILFNHLTGERFELSEEDMAKRFIQNGPTIMPHLNGAYKEGGILSPIDGSFITSRAQLRRHNNTHQVRQGGDYRPGDLIAKGKARQAEQVRRGKGGSVKWQ